MHLSQSLIFAYLIRFRTKMVVLNDSVQIYATPIVIPGYNIFGEDPIPSQRDLLVNIWAVNLGM